MTHLLFPACSTCRATTILGGGDAAQWSIFFLLVIIVGLLSIIGVCMVRLARRSRQYADPSLSDDWNDDHNAS